MAKKLTAGVLQGKSYTETMKDLEFNGEMFELEIRALDNEEATKVQTPSNEGVYVKMKPGLKGKMTRNVDLNMKENFRGQQESNYLAVAYGTTDESITYEVVKSEFPRKLVKEIAERVKQISGISNPEEVKGFSEGEDTPSDEG
ncbi:hypothetical protein MUN89_15680 [Halobacillus salinarum]|uniref:Phage protein n=1 Tax=Halobacillus salinarum TaxID=2932257 RepID=A0ABY4EGT7_9BACI|nr:hypothetical protein [Halobacillus salinarum]UOQ43351.1 hypothetical protein MUN89_15680 [Halobacillus salinarum]